MDPSATVRTWRWRLINVVTAAHVQVYRASRGRILGGIRGAPFLMLNHVGRKSGKWFTTPLVFLPDDERMVVVASKGGSHKHPAWFLNLREMDDTTVEVKGRTIPVSVKVATPKQREQLWPRVVDLYSGYADYQRRTEREIPLVILSPND